MKKLPNIDCVVKVRFGRGFVIGGDESRFVVTAAHCLPKLPPAHAMSYFGDRTYKNLLASLGRKTSIWAECLFADPVADIALLTAPDNQELYEQAEEFENLVNSCCPLQIGNPRSGDGWMLSLDNIWVPTHVAVHDCFRASMEIDYSRPGQSGSPILNRSGQAIGMIVVGGNTTSGTTGQVVQEHSIGNPILTCALPCWFLELVTSFGQRPTRGRERVKPAR